MPPAQWDKAKTEKKAAASRESLEVARSKRWDEDARKKHGDAIRAAAERRRKEKETQVTEEITDNGTN